MESIITNKIIIISSECLYSSTISLKPDALVFKYHLRVLYKIPFPLYKYALFAKNPCFLCILQNSEKVLLFRRVFRAQGKHINFICVQSKNLLQSRMCKLLLTTPSTAMACTIKVLRLYIMTVRYSSVCSVHYDSKVTLQS